MSFFNLFFPWITLGIFLVEMLAFFKRLCVSEMSLCPLISLAP